MSTARHASLIVFAIALAMTAGVASWAANSQALASASPETSGQSEHHGKLRTRFEAANMTHDGCLTLAQAQSGHLKRIVENFDAIDTTHRSCVHFDEVRQWMHDQADIAPGYNPAGGGTQ